MDSLLLFHYDTHECLGVLGVEPVPVPVRIARRPGVADGSLVRDRDSGAAGPIFVWYGGENIQMEPDTIPFGIFERPTAPALRVKKPTVGLMVPDPAAHHVLDRLRSGQMLDQRDLAHQVDVIARLGAVADRPDDCSKAEGTLRIDARLSQGSGIVTSLKPASNRLVTVDCVLIFARRYVNFAGDQIEKLRILFSINGHGREPLLF